MKKILIVENDAMIAAVFRGKFTRNGLDVLVAQDGKEGLEQITAWKPDLVILDLMLPRVGGLSLLRSLRTSGPVQDIPVIVYSNSFSKSTEAEARALGASHMLTKTETRPNQLMDIVMSVLYPAALAAPVQEALNEQSERVQCRQTARHLLSEMRPLLKEFFSRNDVALLHTLHRKIHTFGANAWIAGLQRAAHLSDVLEMLLRVLCEHPKYITFSTDKTVLQAIECLGRMSDDSPVNEIPLQKPAILIVDDQEIALHAANLALKKAKLPAVGMTDPVEALNLLESTPFDLVLLDIDMPYLDGMELCTHLRTFPLHEKTPVVFFSQLSEVGYRIGSSAAGGSDFIGKPFLAIELTVKALVWLLNPPVQLGT